MPETQDQTVSEAQVEQAIRLAVERYFDDCRARIPAFIDRHFHYPGAISTNRMALGWDMLRAPINLLWAPVYALACVLKWLVLQRISTGAFIGNNRRRIVCRHGRTGCVCGFIRHDL
ncbi:MULTISPECIES: DUF6635 family protein [Marinobacter]|jgi:hypothetical protein|uniref:DUF6635 family protein n=1 Tax=Marinobacter TaxID=2742 RepID=UPI001D0D0384|nr:MULTISPECIES: DUF6635 family protein [unclassified Marinobacter]